MHCCVRAIKIRWFKAFFKAEDLASAIIDILTMDEDSVVRIKSDQAVSFMEDRAATNRAAYTNTLSGLFIGADLNECFGHTIMHVGEKLETPLLDDLLSLMNQVSSKSYHYRAGFKALTGKVPIKVSDTRWWLKTDQVEQIKPTITNGGLLGLFRDLVRLSFH